MKFAFAVAALAGLCLHTPFSFAQETWEPTKNVELVVGVEAGGTVDTTARLLAKALTDNGLVKKPITVVNKPGSGQAQAMAYIRQHKADAHYLILSSPSLISTAIANGAPKPYADFSNLAKLFDGDLVVATGVNSGLNSVGDVAERLKQDVKSVSFSFATSAGNPSHVALAQFAQLVGADPRALRTVINGGSPDTLAQIAGGHVDIGISSLKSMMPMVEAGKIKVLGLLGPKRLEGSPDLPTFTELGFNVVATAWYGVSGAPGISDAEKAFWTDAFKKAMETPEITKAAVDNNWTIGVLGPNEFNAFLDSQWDSQRKALVDLGLISN